MPLLLRRTGRQPRAKVPGLRPRRHWIRERCRDLWGREGWRWRVIRTSNAYVFHDPAAAARRRLPTSKCKNPSGTLGQEDSYSSPAVTVAARPVSEALNKALERLGATIAATDAGLQEATCIAGLAMQPSRA